MHPVRCGSLTKRSENRYALLRVSIMLRRGVSKDERTLTRFIPAGAGIAQFTRAIELTYI